jgi:hypothetical protein
MRFLSVFLLLLPVFAQQPPAAPIIQQAPPPAAAKPEAQAPAAAKPDEAAQANAAAETKAESPVPSAESWVNGYLDFGYRWVGDVQGNFQQYRSVVNLGEGPKLFGFDLTFQGPSRKLYDTLTLRGMGWGGDPYNTAHLAASKAKGYDLRIDYRNIAYFNAVPSFANPIAPAGFNERTFDMTRRDASFELDLFPGRRIIPFLAYDRNTGTGRGIETWVLGATNEFPVPYNIRNHTDRYRGGVRFELNRFHLTLEQGGTTYKEDDNTLWTGNNLGDRTTPINGQLTRLNSLIQAYGVRGTGVFSRILMTARPADWLHFHGQFLYSQPKTTVNYAEIASGNLYDFSTAAFFPGQFNLASGNAIQPRTSGNGGVELQFGRLRLLETLTIDRFHDSGFGLFSSRAYQNFQVSPSEALNVRQSVSYKQAQTDLIFDVTRGLTLRASHRYTRGDTTVRAGDLSQIGPADRSELHRTVGIFGFTYRPVQRLTVNGDYEASSSDRVFFRTSLNEYHRARLQSKLQLTSSLLLQARFRILDNQNPAPDIRFDFRSRNNSLALFWTPAGGKHVSFMGEYDRSTIVSDIRYLDLPFLTPATSSYRDVAHQATAAVDVNLPRLNGAKLSAGGSLFVSRGSRPTRYYQPLGRLTVPLHKNVQWNAEWQYYGFGEQFFFFEAFRTHVFMTGLRLTR